MTKTQEELKALKQEYETLNKKLKELSEDELNAIIGGFEFIDSDDYTEDITYEE